MLFIFSIWQKKLNGYKQSIILIVLCLNISACNDLVDHQSFAWSGGGAYPKLTMSGESKFLVSDVSGLWKEDINNATWVRSNKGLDNLGISNIEFSNEEPAIGYITTEHGIFKTKNYGDNWALISEIGKTFQSKRGNSYKTIAIFHNDPHSFIYFDKYGGLFEFENSIVTRISLPLHDEFISSIMLVNSGKHLLVGTSKHRYKLEKINSIWKVIEETNLSTLDITYISINTLPKIITVGDQSISISTDNGNTWKLHNLAQLIGSKSILSRVTSNSSEEGELQIVATWHQGWRSGIILSVDGGVTWNQAGKSLDFSHSNPTRKWKKYSMDKILSVHMSSAQPNNIMVTTYWGVWESTDLGGSWSENFIDGASNTVGSSIELTDNGEVLTASMDVGIINYNVNSTEKSITSLLPNNPDYNIHKHFAGHFWNVISDKSRIIATSSPWDSQKNQIVISEDSGATWSATTTGLPSSYATENTIWEKGYARALIQDKNNPQRFLLGIDGYGLFFSIDGGYSWAPSNSQPTNLRIYNALALNPINDDIYWGTVGNGVYFSDNNGDSWSHSGLWGASIFDMKATESGDILAGVAGWKTRGAKLYIKQHKKKNWRKLKDFPFNYSIDSITLDAKNPDIIVIGLNNWSFQNSGRIFISNNRGKSWDEIEGDFGIGASDMVISNEKKKLYFVGYSQGVSSIDLSEFYD